VSETIVGFMDRRGAGPACSTGSAMISAAATGLWYRPSVDATVDA
jgi:hypothetical protein